MEKNLEEAQKFKDAFEPDFVKVMTDGLFNVPYDLSFVKKAEDLKNIRPLPEDHPWFRKSRELAEAYRRIYGEDVLIFYNVFAPLAHLQAALNAPDAKNDRVLDFLKEDPEAVAEALMVIADNTRELVSQVIGEGAADGIYFSATNRNRVIPEETYLTYVKPSEVRTIERIHEWTPDIILHICGYMGAKNILSVYRDYDVTAVNWAVHAEEMDLKEGKQYFGGKAVIGGFLNTKDSILYRGTKEEIEAYVEKILAETGTTGVILGADCTVPEDINPEHLAWVREKAARF